MTDRAGRGRVTAAATLAVAVLLAVVSVAVVGSQRRQLTEAVEDFAELRLADLLPAIETGEAGTIENLGDQQDLFVQVVVAGEVRASTANVAAFDPLFVPSCDHKFTTEHVRALDASDYRVLHRCVEVEGAAGVAHVGVNLDDVDESVAALERSLAVAVPALLILLAFLLWWLVGRLLARVLAAAAREQRFVADAAHELRSPLARMQAALEVDGTAAVDAVLDDTVAMGRLVDDLLTLARLDAGAAAGRTPVDLDDLVAEVVARERERWTVTWDLHRLGAGQTIGDPEQLRRVVRNLLENAARHARTTVAVALGEDAGSVVLRVADDGDGIPEAARRRVFDRFARLDAARSASSGGTGLGLAIASEIVTRHRGTITIETATLGGAEFIVTLPAASSSPGRAVS